MKRILFFIALAAVSISCGRNAYTIDGTFTKDDGTEVYLIDLNVSDTLAVTTVQGGKFVFQGTVSKPFYAYVGRDRERIRMILEPGTAAVDLDNRTVFGMPMMEAMNAYNEVFYDFDRVRREARKALTDRKAELTDAEFNAAWAELDESCKQSKVALCDSMVRANRYNLVGAIVMNDLGMVDPDAFLTLYEILPETIQQHYLVSGPHALAQAVHETTLGMLFKDYTVVGGNPDGTDVKLSDYVGKGKYILLDHWASWCGPCKAEMPYIKKTWETFAGDRFDVVSVAVSDKREDTVDALAKLDMPWHQILDAQKIPSEVYGVNAIPHLILFAPDGTILKRGLRGEEIYTTLAELLH